MAHIIGVLLLFLLITDDVLSEGYRNLNNEEIYLVKKGRVSKRSDYLYDDERHDWHHEQDVEHVLRGNDDDYDYDDENGDRNTIAYDPLEYECLDHFKSNIGNEDCQEFCRTFGCEGRCFGELCYCHPSMSANQCDIDCPVGRWGRGCRDECNYCNGSPCHPRLGDCECRGSKGLYCREPCPPGSYGSECALQCKCQNNADCDRFSGFCNCTAGYQGPYCEEKCPLGSHGYQCSDICKCQNDAFCHHVDGSCECTAGWTGPVCAENCPKGFFGINCSGICKCQNHGICDLATGECHCREGFYGDYCETYCLSEVWGKECSQEYRNSSTEGSKCEGNWTCLPGFYGANCDKKDCLADRWGLHCLRKCNCSNHGSCHPLTGVCCCEPPWTGKHCSIDMTAQFLKESNESSAYSSVIIPAICIPIIILLLIIIGVLFYKRRSSVPEKKVDEYSLLSR